MNSKQKIERHYKSQLTESRHEFLGELDNVTVRDNAEIYRMDKGELRNNLKELLKENLQTKRDSHRTSETWAGWPSESPSEYTRK